MARSIIEVTGPTEVVAGPSDSISLSIPIRFKRSAGRRRNPVPKETAVTQFSSVLLTPNQRLLGRAFRWSRMIEHGQVASMSEIAWRERKDSGYIARIINLTMLAPGIIKPFLTIYYRGTSI
jgi:hypothetical protein